MIKYFSVAIFTYSGPLRIRVVLGQDHSPGRRGNETMGIYKEEIYVRNEHFPGVGTQ